MYLLREVLGQLPYIYERYDEPDLRPRAAERGNNIGGSSDLGTF
jgi:hypothetical protein